MELQGLIKRCDLNTTGVDIGEGGNPSSESLIDPGASGSVRTVENELRVNSPG